MALTRAEWRQAKDGAAALYAKAGIVLNQYDLEHMEIIDFGFADLDKIGIQLITYVNDDRYCAKELLLFPHQTCPEHRHPPIPAHGDPGKQETFRCRYGGLYFYVEGQPASGIKARIPAEHENVLTVRHEIILRPGDQFTLPRDTWHWFQAGPEGCVVSEYSSKSREEYDLWTDKRIIRKIEFVD